MTQRQQLARSTAINLSKQMPYHEKISVPCSHCTVKANEHCITPVGAETTSAHVERIMAAWRARSAGFDVKIVVRQRDRVLRDPEALSFSQRAAGAKSLDKLKHECKIRKIATDALKGLSI
jgi:hypothetical protein